MPRRRLVLWTVLLAAVPLRGADLPRPAVEGQPLGANVRRLIDALDTLGTPLPTTARDDLLAAVDQRDADRLQRLLDGRVFLAATLTADGRVRVQRGAALAVVQQAGYTPLVVKVHNPAGVRRPFRLTSPQAGLAFAGVAALSMERQAQRQFLDDPNASADKGRFLHLETYTSQPMTERLSGLEVEYVVVLVSSSLAGRREATVGVDGGDALPIAFDVRPAVPVKLEIFDVDGLPTTGRFVFRDRAGHIYPPQARRLAPDLFFQAQVYRHHGETVLLPPGSYTMTYNRGPEYRQLRRDVTIPDAKDAALSVRLERWIDPRVGG